MGTPTRNDNSGCGCGPSENESAATNPAKTSGTGPTTGDSDASRRTGPSTGNTSGNDLPSQGKTTRDTRSVEGSTDEVPGRQAAGSEVTGSQGQGTPEVIDAD